MKKRCIEFPRHVLSHCCVSLLVWKADSNGVYEDQNIHMMWAIFSCERDDNLLKSIGKCRAKCGSMRMLMSFLFMKNHFYLKGETLKQKTFVINAFSWLLQVRPCLGFSFGWELLVVNLTMLTGMSWVMGHKCRNRGHTSTDDEESICHTHSFVLGVPHACVTIWSDCSKNLM